MGLALIPKPGANFQPVHPGHPVKLFGFALIPGPGSSGPPQRTQRSPRFQNGRQTVVRMNRIQRDGPGLDSKTGGKLSSCSSCSSCQTLWLCSDSRAGKLRTATEDTEITEIPKREANC